MRHLGLWTLSNLPSIGVGQQLAGVGPGLERVPRDRRGRDNADPDKRGLAAIVRHGDAMIRHPCNTLVGGPSGCGKSTWTRGLLRHADELMHPPPRVKHYCYGAWQPAFDEMKQEKVQFHEGLPTSEELDQWFGPTQGGLLVLDDLMDEGANDKRVLDLFSKHSHHRNISVLFLCQDLFPPGKFAKTISRNAHYIVAFKNPRDQVGMRTLTLQAFPNDWSHVMNIFRECTQRPFGYLMLDLHPASDDRYRLFTNVLPEEGPTETYERQA